MYQLPDFRDYRTPGANLVIRRSQVRAVPVTPVSGLKASINQSINYFLSLSMPVLQLLPGQPGYDGSLLEEGSLLPVLWHLPGQPGYDGSLLEEGIASYLSSSSSLAMMALSCRRAASYLSSSFFLASLAMMALSWRRAASGLLRSMSMSRPPLSLVGMRSASMSIALGLQYHTSLAEPSGSHILSDFKKASSECGQDIAN